MSGGMNASQDASDASSSQQIEPAVDQAGFMATTDDQNLIEMLRRGDEAAFVLLVDRYSNTMVRLALIYVAAWAVAEEVVQETWMAVLEGLNRFEGRSSLKTWIFRILTNCAKKRAQREGRSIPFSSLFDSEIDSAEPVVDPDRFLPADHQWAGRWVSFPSKWEDLPDERLLSQETAAFIKLTIDTLPPGQKEIITLRDIEGWTSDEACTALGISRGNQRVLLHRARAKVRSALEKYFREE